MTSVSESVAVEQATIELEKLKRKTKALQRDKRNLQSALDELDGQNAQLRTLLELQEEPTHESPEWLVDKPSGDHKAIVCTLFSDTHFDEVVRKAEVNGINSYNRKRAESRLEQYFTTVPYIAKHMWSGVDYEGAVCALGGDMVSGAIHSELRETNEAPTLATVRHFAPLVAEGLKLLADEFGRVHVPCVVGNHGRQTKEVRYKLRVLDNADWLMYSLVEMALKDDDRITFQIPESPDALFKVYKTKYLLYHGEIKGGFGVGGIWPPIMRLKGKKLKLYNFDWLVCGHWHQYVHAQGLIINGSIKGYDEYAMGNHFPPERPQQALWLTTPENGITVAAPVFAE